MDYGQKFICSVVAQGGLYSSRIVSFKLVNNSSCEIIKIVHVI